MKKYKHLYLTGCMGCGKTTVGEIVAKKLGRRFVDLDKLIEQKAGKSINQIFQESGEEGFRNLETQALLSLPPNPMVIATGGGSVLRQENRDLMKKNGAIIWLDVPVEALAQRLSGDEKRPLLKNQNVKERLEEIMRERSEFYADCTYRLDGEDMTPLQISIEIVNFMKR